MPDFNESKSTMKRLTSEELKIDVFRLLADMHKANVNNSEVARRMGVGRSTLRRWKEGIQEPSYSEGLRLIQIHAYVCRISTTDM